MAAAGELIDDSWNRRVPNAMIWDDVLSAVVELILNERSLLSQHDHNDRRRTLTAILIALKRFVRRSTFRDTSIVPELLRVAEENDLDEDLRKHAADLAAKIAGR